MINIDLISNIQEKYTGNTNSKNEIKSSKTYEVKDDFKSYLKKEVKKDTSKEDKSVDLNKDTKDLKAIEPPETKDAKETLETSLEKIKKAIEENSKDDDIEAEEIIEVINLLSNLLVTGEMKVNTEINVEELVDSNILVEDNLDYLKTLISELTEVVGNSEENTTFNLDNKGIMENLISLGDLINNMLESKGSTDINLDKEALNKEILNLLTSLSEKDMENLNLSENQGKIKEIISSLTNIKNYNENLEVKKEPISLNKENINLNDSSEVKIQSSNLQEKSSNSELGNSLNKNTSEEVSNEMKEEDKILSKFLGEDNKGTFANTLTSYDRLKNNSVNVIQKPEFINNQTMDADIIKSVKYMMKNNVEELTVKVYPKELGELTIKILSEEGIMKAEIKATSKETYSILNANIAEIKNSLSDQNIKIQEVQVAIYNDDTTFFSGKENSKENQKGNSSSGGKVDSINLNENEDLITEDMTQGNVNLLV